MARGERSRVVDSAATVSSGDFAVLPWWGSSTFGQSDRPATRARIDATAGERKAFRPET
jgi:hypothetical protein